MSVKACVIGSLYQTKLPRMLGVNEDEGVLRAHHEQQQPSVPRTQPVISSRVALGITTQNQPLEVMALETMNVCREASRPLTS